MNERSRGASFEEVAMPLFDALYNYARWLTGDPTEAEDLVQETYLKGLKGFGSFTPGTNFRAWMYRILRNTFLTSRTGLRAVPPISIDEDPEVLGQMTDEETPEWHLLQQRSSFAGHGRSYGQGDIFRGDGQLAASFVQDAMIRARSGKAGAL